MELKIIWEMSVRISTVAYRSVPQAGLLEQRQNPGAEEFEFGQEVEKVDLNAVAAGILQTAAPIDDLLRVADQMHVAANRPVFLVMTAP